MVTITDLTFSYPKQPRLFDRLSLTIPSGRIYGLLGRNGAGKSTLLRTICGLHSPRSGRCTTLGYPSCDRRPDMLSRIYFLPEEFWIPAVTVMEYADLYAPFYPAFSRVDLCRHLADLGVNRSAGLGALSHGEKKKALIAFALAANTSLLLLDEPTNGLDIPSKGVLRRKLVEALTPERLIVVATHQVREMENLFDTIIIIDSGSVLFHQTIQDIGSRISFQVQREAPDPAETLWAQPIPGGFSVASRNALGDESPVDLEVLFSLVTTRRSDIDAIFATEVTGG